MIRKFRRKYWSNNNHNNNWMMVLMIGMISIVTIQSFVTVVQAYSSSSSSSSSSSLSWRVHCHLCCYYSSKDDDRMSRLRAVSSAEADATSVVKKKEDVDWLAKMGRSRMDDSLVFQAIVNLMGVCGNLQKPELYSAAWADSCHYNTNNDQSLTTSLEIVQEGEILSLCPIHAIGILTISQQPTITTISSPSKEANNDDSPKNNKDSLFIASFHNQDGTLSTKMATMEKLLSSSNNNDILMNPVDLLDEVSFPYPMFHGRRSDLFTIFHQPKPMLDQNQEDNPSHPPLVDGWKGHIPTTKNFQSIKITTDKEGNNSIHNTITNDDIDGTNNSKLDNQDSNCILLPLPGAAPLCALVSTKPISIHQKLHLVDTSSTFQRQRLSKMIAQRYASEIAELKQYTDMAYSYPKTLYLPSPKRKFQYPFYHMYLNQEYPNLQILHNDPHVYMVKNFLTDQECDDLIEMARPKLIPCFIKNERTGKVEPDPNRSSTNANLSRQSISPEVIDKIKKWTNCPDDRYLETFQVLRYEPGQQFQPHTDGFPGPTSACGFHQSGRLVTLFVYLNTLPTGQGGETQFTQLHTPTNPETNNNKKKKKKKKKSYNYHKLMKKQEAPPLTISPQRGMAVMHFPNTLGLEEDVQTEHTGLPPKTMVNEKKVDVEKWLLVTWIWKNFRSDEIYSEQNI